MNIEYSYHSGIGRSIAFIADQHHGELISVFYSQYVLVCLPYQIQTANTENRILQLLFLLVHVCTRKQPIFYVTTHLTDRNRLYNTQLIIDLIKGKIYVHVVSCILIQSPTCMQMINASKQFIRVVLSLASTRQPLTCCDQRRRRQEGSHRSVS